MAKYISEKRMDRMLSLEWFFFPLVSRADFLLFFLLLLLYEWEHKTVIFCPFLSLFFLRKGRRR